MSQLRVTRVTSVTPATTWDEEETQTGNQVKALSTVYAFFGADTIITRISVEKVERFVDELYRLKCTDGTVLNYINLLHGILETSLKKKWVTQNVVESIDNRPEARNRKKPNPLRRTSSRRCSTSTWTTTWDASIRCSIAWQR